MMKDSSPTSSSEIKPSGQTVDFTKIRGLLEEKYGLPGREAADRLDLWLSGSIPYSFPDEIKAHFATERIPLIYDAFRAELSFGTGGRRGRVGYGPNRFNPTNLAMTVQGHCNYLKTAFPGREDLFVVVANDVRAFNDIAGIYGFLGKDHPLIGVSSRSLGKLACQIYAANGIKVYFEQPEADSALLSTPELSFLIAKLGAAGGINISASHNHPDDNGVKVYDAFGSQPVPPDDQNLADIMLDASEIKIMPYEQAVAQGLVRPVPETLHAEYIANYLSIYGDIFPPDPNIKITFTPLCGCGLTTVGKVLTRLGFPIAVPPDQGPDGAFSVIPFRAPNPEVPQSTEPARVFADRQGSSIVLSSDPDADRVGLEVKLADGSWYHFDGNQIAAVLCYFLMLDPRGPRRKGLVIETLVTTKILGRIVAEAGDSYLVDDLLVGFKYVADVLKKLEQDRRYGEIPYTKLVFAAEESHGVIVDPGIRDKDAVPACMYLAALHQRMVQEGKTLLDYYVGILEKLGGYDCVNRSIMMSGAEGMERKNAIMQSLRSDPPTTLAGRAVTRASDYWDERKFGPIQSDTDELSRNVLQFATDSFVITVRPSGTEPKLKFYCQLMSGKVDGAVTGPALLDQVRKQALDITSVIYNELLARIGLALGEAALLLPDIVDLNAKTDFDKTVTPWLRASVEQDTAGDLEALFEQLRSQTRAMTPGADPLPALKAPLRFLFVEWRKSFAGNALFDALVSWSRG